MEERLANDVEKVHWDDFFEVENGVNCLVITALIPNVIEDEAAVKESEENINLVKADGRAEILASSYTANDYFISDVVKALISVV